MGTLVVGYDGSDGAKAALAKAVELAGSSGDVVVAVFGYEPPSIRAGGPVGYQKDAIEHLAREVLAEAAASVEGSGVTVETVEVEALPMDAILETATARNASMVVVGGRGEGPIKGAIIGSTTYKLVHHSTLPVLVVPGPG